MVFQFSNSITSKMNKPSGPPPPSNFDGANAIWSTKLRISTYTGACLKLRRSTDSVIADFYADASGNLGTGLGGNWNIIFVMERSRHNICRYVV